MNYFLSRTGVKNEGGRDMMKEEEEIRRKEEER
jgi:hypothetical protein